ncbi:ABC transporter substrate-binding protein [Aestuariirhabdus sp. LZHN29]|uniref:ABC transporter substrate-binding protein n=1 Tax=Aestuariirhabdus sp. LZHN29 TaxID=3417462 RepID=UPI003CF42493
MTNRVTGLAKGVALLGAGLLIGCSDPVPLKLGVSVGLTGPAADLGREARDGVMLGVEQVNADGGVHGRQLELLVRDDGNTPELALKADRELIDAGVVAIVGHVTSAMSVAAIEQINDSKLLMVSPTTSTSQLTGKNDYFLRVYEVTRDESIAMANYAFDILGTRDVAIVYDFSNRAFTEDWGDHFKAQFTERGGEVSFEAQYTTSNSPEFKELGAGVQAKKHDLVLILAPALDAARLCQQLRKQGYMGNIMTSAWSTTSDLISHGGNAVEGVISPSAFDRGSDHSRFTAFREAFVSRFGYEPGFAGTMAHEAGDVVIRTLQTMDKSTLDSPYLSEKLRDEILKQSRFEGLQGPIVFDAFGEVDRTNFLIQVRNGQFVTVDDQ